MSSLSNNQFYMNIFSNHHNRVASHAKKHLDVAKEAGKDLPPNAFRAFLHCVNNNIRKENN